MSELKSCPFCGEHGEGVDDGTLVGCSDQSCPASLLNMTAEQWNTRARDAEIAEAVELAHEIKITEASWNALTARQRGMIDAFIARNKPEGTR